MFTSLTLFVVLQNLLFKHSWTAHSDTIDKCPKLSKPPPNESPVTLASFISQCVIENTLNTAFETELPRVRIQCPHFHFAQGFMEEGSTALTGCTLSPSLWNPRGHPEVHGFRLRTTLNVNLLVDNRSFERAVRLYPSVWLFICRLKDRHILVEERTTTE